METHDKPLYNLLYVDDEESNLRIFRSSFKRHYNIFTAASAEEGIRILAEQPIHLIITDQKMPEMTGVEFLERILPDYPEAIRIILTGYSDVDDITRAINRCGIYRYLVKPWNKEEMVLTLDKALETYQLRQDNKELLQALKLANEDLEEKVRLRTQNLIAANDELKRAKEKAEEASKAKEQFLSMMSHEIRTPLNAIIGVTNLLSQMELTADQRENTEILSFSAKNLLNLINDVLDLSKIEAGKMELEELEFDLKALLTNLTESFKHKAKEKDLQIKLHIDKNIPAFLIGDSVRLSQIVNNLMSNALKFTEEGYVQLTVRLAKNFDESVEILFAVSDTGIGIENDRLQSIFENFSQAGKDISRKYGGTGLGLAITKQLVELQGGSISAMSTPMVGSTFSFQIPLKKVLMREEKNTNLLRKEQTPNPIEMPLRLEGVQVLVVEDNRVNQTLARKFLTNWGAEVTLAENGKRALEKMAQMRFDIILMDLQMPEMDGYEAAIHIRRNESPLAQIPIIALTASTLTKERERAFQVGMNDYITKPFDPAELYKKIVQYTIQKAAPEPTEQAEQELDVSYYQNLAGKDRDFYLELLDLTSKEIALFRQELQEAFDSAQVEMLRLAYHKIKATLRCLKLDWEEPIQNLRLLLQTQIEDPNNPENAQKAKTAFEQHNRDLVQILQSLEAEQRQIIIKMDNSQIDNRFLRRV
ncbi:response regulator [Hugenholtzia roseola]|uniref:response regulator n=1 Tax=Hugenholtzia roseola TaxID=1002 RepID=UPI00040E3ECE|nr:response regulator [Hugenholtzia roseola]